MVVLNKIYTRTGDDGETGIGDGSRVSKLDARIVAGGSVDETNSFIGVAASHCSADDKDGIRPVLESIQQRLFDLGADITCPWDPDATEDRCPRIAERHVLWLEQQIDLINNDLQPLKSFVLPGGSVCAAALHVARSVCRRAEIDVLQFQQQTRINPQIAIYLNRLSDFLFVAARQSNNNGNDDVLWQPDTGAQAVTGGAKK